MRKLSTIAPRKTEREKLDKRERKKEYDCYTLLLSRGREEFLSTLRSLKT